MVKKIINNLIKGIPFFNKDRTLTVIQGNVEDCGDFLFKMLYDVATQFKLACGRILFGRWVFVC